MMYDPSYNFYEVVEAAEAHFADKGKGKGSGWKGFQRWVFENEPKYYPSGDRSSVDLRLPEKAFMRLKAEEASDYRALFPDGWQDLGPYSIDSVTGHYSAGLGRIETFYVDPLDDNHLYIGSRSGGFWKTYDGGASWEGSTTAYLVASGINTMSVSPTNSDSVLINLRNAQNGTTHGIYRSIDGGDSWEETNFNPTTLGWGGLGSNAQINKVAYHPTIPNLIFVCTNTGLYRSEDNLSTWTNIMPTSQFTEIEFHPSNPNIVYLYDNTSWSGNRDLVFTSTDIGVSFTPGNIIPGNANASGEFSASADCPDCLFYASTNGVWKSTDNGVNFTLLSVPTGSCDGFVVNDLDENVMIYGYLDIYKSLDGGSSWSLSAGWTMTAADYWSGDYVHADLREAKCYSGVIYLSTDGLFARSYDNGFTWEILTNDVSIRENYNLGLSQSNHYRTISGSQDNGTSIKKKDTWVEFYGADGMEGIIHPTNDDFMMGSVQYGTRRRTITGGTTQNGATPPGQTGGWIAPLMYDPNDQMVIYSVGENIHRSDDFGISWTVMGTPSFTGTIDYAAIAENNSDIIVCSNNEKIELSMDQGVTWTDIKGTLPNYSITDIAFDPNDDNTIVVVYGRYQSDGQKVYISHNMGATWTNITFNVFDMPIRSVLIDHSDASNIYLGAEIGVFTMPMGGGSWALYNPDLPNVAIRDMEVMWGSNTLRVASWGNGLWEYHTVDRKDYPAIITTENSDPPTYELPTEENPQMVTSVISYENELSSVFCLWSEGSPTFDNSIPMINIMDSTWQTKDPIPAFPTGTKVYFKVFAVGAVSDTTETYKFMYETKDFSYCDAIGDPGTGSDYIDYVELNSVSNASGQDYYGDFTAVIIDLWEDSTYTLELNLNYSWDPDTCGAWIDYDHNGIFEADEFILMSELNVSHESFGTFVVPDVGIYVDDTVRMRVRNLYWDTPPTPCGTVSGEVEDYSIALKGFPDIYFELSEDSICVDETVDYMYCGEGLDSVSWTFTNGMDSYMADGLSGTVTLGSGGWYDMIITAYKYGQEVPTTFTNVVYVEELDLGVTVSGFTLSADMSGVSYQWIDCNSGMSAISGATDQIYTATTDGSYAVVLTSAYCTDTTACFTLDQTSLDEFGSIEVLVHPNPTNSKIELTFNRIVNDVKVQIIDVSGKVVFGTFAPSAQKLFIDLEQHADGLYYVDISSEEFDKVIKVIKQ